MPFLNRISVSFIDFCLFWRKVVMPFPKYQLSFEVFAFPGKFLSRPQKLPFTFGQTIENHHIGVP